jgi:hypothetical protein
LALQTRCYSLLQQGRIGITNEMLCIVAAGIHGSTLYIQDENSKRRLEEKNTSVPYHGYKLL